MTKRFNRRQMLLTTALLTAGSVSGRAKLNEGLSGWFHLPEGGINSARAIQPAPHRLVEDGKIHAGVFAAPAGQANLSEAELFRGPKALWRRKRLMEWFGYGVRLQEWYLGMIIIDAKLAPISSVYAVNRRDGTFFSHDMVAGRVKVAAGPWNDHSMARGPGYDLEFVHLLEKEKNAISLDLSMPGKPRIRGEIWLTEDMDKSPPLCAVVPTQPPYFFYTHKACMPAQGSVEIGNEKITLDPRRDMAILDEHRNYAQSPALWTWGTGAAYEGDGRLIAFNLGDTGGIDQEHWNENCLWTGDRLELLGPVKWSHNKKDPFQSWSVREIHGRAELRFSPQNGKTVSLPPLGKYYQMAGHYNGFLVDEQGERHEIENLYGCAENGAIGAYTK